MPRATARALIELLSSMRFAISLLTVLAIASIIGTVVRQNEAFNAYLNQFGQFWFLFFGKLGLYSVYNASWFTVILAFLVLSTALCVIRQAPLMWREICGFREHAREASLQLFHHHATLTPAVPADTWREVVTNHLAAAGFRFKVNERIDGVLFAAKQGSAGRVGYFFAHGAIVLICLGGLLDGNLPLRLMMTLEGKAPAVGNQLIADMPAAARLDVDNFSYRANVYIPEGRSSSMGVLNIDDGILLQPLPFTISLKRFIIDHYENGMPRRFASEVLITDTTSGESFERTIEVNKPLEFRGVTLYQSSFDDGGSILHFAARSFAPTSAPPLEFEGEVGSSMTLSSAGDEYSFKLELTGFRPVNVENMLESSATNMLDGLLGNGAHDPARRELRNLGPSYTYKLRDATGQALEFNNYMLPLQVNGRWYHYSGMRASQMEPFRYLRIPLDDGSIDTWFGMRRTLFDPARRSVLARRFADRNLDAPDDNTLHERLTAAAEHTLTLFSSGGFDAVGKFITANIPEAERDSAGEAFIKIMQGLAWESWQMAREEAGKPIPEADDSLAGFVRDSLAALSDSTAYGAPFYLQLSAYEQRQASVLQASRSPGKPLVYLGSLLLVIGVFAMLYVRERRLFVLLRHGTMTLAMSSNRKTIDVDETFIRHRDTLAAALQATISPPPQ
ncbi:cytochrome c biogenesis protein [Betaproteobacteria bacterium]|nr:cytochrome c biogenesis protein [Betaproteobacteria bacterium]GHU21103.1 cytochrome c biogenesis protein [Betaproteobacteria bacterium]